VILHFVFSVVECVSCTVTIVNVIAGVCCSLSVQNGVSFEPFLPQFDCNVCQCCSRQVVSCFGSSITGVSDANWLHCSHLGCCSIVRLCHNVI